MSDSWHTTPLNPIGSIVQVASTNDGAVATGTGTIPHDDTIPQNTEGNEFMTRAITPKSSSNVLIIEAVIFLSNSIATHLTAALFQDTTAGALAVAMNYGATATEPRVLVVKHVITAGTTSSTTFKIRAGGSAASTTTFNGEAGGRLYGAITKSNFTIYEVKV